MILHHSNVARNMDKKIGLLHFSHSNKKTVFFINNPHRPTIILRTQTPPLQSPKLAFPLRRRPLFLAVGICAE
jgi:hypothetical protein